ncbi:Oidioi.mRNA.OKI2018_I69.chr2.g7295.t2.cds [Oikopleura dioica]|uniref:Oidioi.mRNA.OKI2018_I69.chr2.g7295.t2.cds n=1 Tax=Oikopleura dioica TaxID=34765 RepID=A0ABN7T664_OIKDI|nr:Oidioi.mRNA.OKI2018_I69.chr2.g7295.t2.cds [Oikopleura dioica]
MEDLTQEEKKVQEVEEIAPEETFDAENTENAPEDQDDQNESVKSDEATPEPSESKSPSFQRAIPAIDYAHKPKHLRERSFRGDDGDRLHGSFATPGGFAEFAASYYQHQRHHPHFMHAGAPMFYAHGPGGEHMQGFHYEPMPRMAQAPMMLMPLGNGQWAPVLMTSGHLPHWSYPSQYYPAYHPHQPPVALHPVVSSNGNNNSTGSVPNNSTDRDQAGSSMHDNSSDPQLNLSEENFPSLPKSNKVQEFNPNGTVNPLPIPCKTSTRIEEKSSIVMKNKDAAIRVNTDKHTGLVTVENPPEWVNEEPSKLENNENSNEYTTEDELEIRDVSQRLSSIRFREHQELPLREVHELPQLRPAYPGHKPTAAQSRRLQELKAQPRSVDYSEQSSLQDNLAVPVNTPCTPCDSEYSKVNMPNLDKSVAPDDLVKATERVRRDREDLDVTATIRHHRRFFRGSERELECYKEGQQSEEREVQQVQIEEQTEAPQEEPSGFRVCVCQYPPGSESNGQEMGRFIHKPDYDQSGHSKDWGDRQGVPPVAAGGYVGRPYRGRGRGRGYRGRGRGHRGGRGGFRGNFRGRGDSNGFRPRFRESSFPSEELGPPLPRRRRNPRFD